LFPPFLRFLAVGCILLWLPGELIRRRLLPHGSEEVHYPLALLGGLSLWALVTWGSWILDVSFTVYVATVQALCALLLVLSLFRRSRSRRIEQAAASGAEDARKRLGTIFIVPAVCIALFFYIFPPQISHQGDALVHIGLFRSIISEDSLSPADAVVNPAGAGEATARSDPRLGASHPLIAAVARIARADPVDVWRWIPVVMAPAAFLAFIGFAGALLPGAGHVLFAVLLFIMFQGGIGREFLGSVAYGQHLSLVFMWLFVALSLRYVREESTGSMIMVALLCTGGALVHIDAVIHFALAFAAFAAFYRVFGFTPRGLAVLGTVLLVGSGSVTGWRVIETYQGGNVLHSHPQGLLYFLDVGDPYFAVSPPEIVRRNGLLFLASLFLVPLLLFQRRHRRFALMSFALSMPPFLTALNPLICPMLYAKLHYLVHRFVLNVPAFLVTALVLGAAVSWGKRGNIWQRAAAVCFLFLWGWVFLVAARAWVSDIRTVQRSGRDKLLTEEAAEAVRFINEKIPAGSVVASDAATSYMLSALTDVKVVAVLGQHGNPNDRHPIERLSALYTMMSPFTSQIETLSVIRRFGVEYILVNGAVEAPYHDFFADWDPQFFPILERKYGTLQDDFQRVYRSEKVLLYRVRATSLERVTWEPAVPYSELFPEAVEPCVTSATGAEVAVVGMSVEPRTALAGETIRLTLAYQRARGSQSMWPLTLRLRFEDERYFANSRRYPGDKYVRRFRERRNGAFHRFRIDRKPFEGYFPAQRWPDTGFCYENVDVRLPIGLDESVYDVQWRLEEETLLPNFALRDFVYNHDSYAGAPCVRMEVRRHVVR
jgi:hypothetical protein